MMLIPLRLPTQDEPLPSDCHILLRLVLPVSILSGAMIGLAIAQVRCRPKAPFQVGGKSADGVHRRRLVARGCSTQPGGAPQPLASLLYSECLPSARPEVAYIFLSIAQHRLMLFTALFWGPALIVVLLVLWVFLVAIKPHKLKVGLFFGTVGKAGSAAGYLLSHALAALHSIFSLLRKAQGQKQGPAPSMRSATTALFPAFWAQGCF